MQRPRRTFSSEVFLSVKLKHKINFTVRVAVRIVVGVLGIAESRNAVDYVVIGNLCLLKQRTKAFIVANSSELIYPNRAYSERMSGKENVFESAGSVILTVGVVAVV